MPQMSPLWWFCLYMLVILLLILFCFLNYHNIEYDFETPPAAYIPLPLSLLWKW
uniref:ATP synthase complex subunit 8 n=1 Tax=Holochlora fruhstorferi TaxID=1945530 RepID=A0A1Q1MPS5_9ORTH|nr:ATP synthase F0 subunit 8 [Holochlora fruhstorferi]AQM40086.1 ATP synthase F0 subunit 8 [Holochlora fruhstorferi]